MWSWSEHPMETLKSGKALGSHRFNGSESLVINFDGDSTRDSAFSLDVYAYAESCLISSSQSVKIHTL